MSQARIDRLKRLLQKKLDATVFSDLKETELMWLVGQGWDTEAALQVAKQEHLSEGVAAGRAAVICNAFAAAGPSSSIAPLASVAAPPAKKAKLVHMIELHSTYKDPQVVKDLCYLPGGLHDSKVAFYAGRPQAVDRNVAPPALLCAPECGIVHDAAYSSSEYRMVPGAEDIAAARELVSDMAKVYDNEEMRQKKLVAWYETYYTNMGLDVHAQASASGAGATGMSDHDGQVVTVMDGRPYLLVVMEVKNESGQAGDPLFQSLAHYQKFYGYGARWDAEPLMRATGAPAFTLEVQGVDLVICVVYTVEGNVVVREPLTPKMPLLDLAERMRRPFERLAAVLAAFRAALRLLDWRFLMMGGGAGLPALEAIASKALSGLEPDARSSAMRAMASATLSAADVAAARLCLDVDGKQHPSHSRPWARLPYPLAPCSNYPVVQSLPCMATKAVFQCTSTARAGDTVHIKFVQRPYPLEVHALLYQHGLTPQCFDVLRLPGGWWMVVQEFLDSSWCTFGSLPPEQQALAFEAVSTAVKQMHKLGIVHGDLRPPNVMLRKGALDAFEVKLVDLEWAGAEGRTKYPLDMAPPSAGTPWHPTAGPGQLLQKTHDSHLLQCLFNVK